MRRWGYWAPFTTRNNGKRNTGMPGPQERFPSRCTRPLWQGLATDAPGSHCPVALRGSADGGPGRPGGGGGGGNPTWHWGCRNACIRTLKCLCTADDYPSVPSFTPCSVLQIPDDTICKFVNDPVYGSDGAFLTPEVVEEERQKKGVSVLKVDPRLEIEEFSYKMQLLKLQGISNGKACIQGNLRRFSIQYDATVHP